MIQLDRKFYLLFGISFVVKLLIGAGLPLSPDEAYYWVWSHHPQLSYFDHPPFVSWLFLFGQPLENMASWVRLPGLIMSHATLFLWVYLLKGLFNQRQLLVFFILALLMPLLGPGGLIITPDTPFMFFWALTLILTQRLVEHKSLTMALLAGVSLGLGFSSKYTIVLLAPVIIVWLYREQKKRAVFFQWLFMGLLGATMGSAPVWIWNLTNDLQSFGFQLKHGFGGGFRPHYFVDYALAQVALIFPTVVFFAWKCRQLAPTWLLLSGGVPLAFFGFSSFFAYAEVNWPIAAHPAILAIAIFGLEKSKAWAYTAAIWGVALTLVLSEAALNWIPKGTLRLKTDTLHSYNAVAEHVRDLESVYFRTYQMASTVSFLNKKMVYKLRGMNRYDFFDSLELSKPQAKEFYLVLKNAEQLPLKIGNRYEILKRDPIDSSFELALVRVRP